MNGSTGEWQVITQNSPGVPGVAESGDRLGASLAIARLGLGRNLVVGVPGEDVGSIQNAGQVAVRWSAGNWEGWTENSRGVPGAAEAGDQFGQVLHADQSGSGFYVGVPSEDIGGAVDAGTVLSSAGFTWELSSENTPGVPGVAEAGDRFGASLAGRVRLNPQAIASLVIGVPGEDIGSVTNAGTVLLRLDGSWEVLF